MKRFLTANRENNYC